MNLQLSKILSAALLGTLLLAGCGDGEINVTDSNVTLSNNGSIESEVKSKEQAKQSADAQVEVTGNQQMQLGSQLKDTSIQIKEQTVAIEKAQVEKQAAESSNNAQAKSEAEAKIKALEKAKNEAEAKIAKLEAEKTKAGEEKKKQEAKAKQEAESLKEAQAKKKAQETEKIAKLEAEKKKAQAEKQKADALAKEKADELAKAKELKEAQAKIKQLEAEKKAALEKQKIADAEAKKKADELKKAEAKANEVQWKHEVLENDAQYSEQWITHKDAWKIVKRKYKDSDRVEFYAETESTLYDQRFRLLMMWDKLKEKSDSDTVVHEHQSIFFWMPEYISNYGEGYYPITYTFDQDSAKYDGEVKWDITDFHPMEGGIRWKVMNLKAGKNELITSELKKHNRLALSFDAHLYDMNTHDSKSVRYVADFPVNGFDAVYKIIQDELGKI